MPARLTIITTRTGDNGTTGLGDGSRVSKSSARINLMGEVDELNSIIGCVLAEPLSEVVHEILRSIQHDLFDMGSELCIPGREMLMESHVARLDALIATLNASLPALAEFILPGGCRAAAQCHLARATCRRAERTLVGLAQQEPISAHSGMYLNRLSDVLFVLSRVINRDAGVEDHLWQPGRNS